MLPRLELEIWEGGEGGSSVGVCVYVMDYDTMCIRWICAAAGKARFSRLGFFFDWAWIGIPFFSCRLTYFVCYVNFGDGERIVDYGLWCSCS